MLKEKVASRGAGITFRSFEPAQVVDQRLAFDIRGEYTRLAACTIGGVFLVPMTFRPRTCVGRFSRD